MLKQEPGEASVAETAVVALGLSMSDENPKDLSTQKMKNFLIHSQQKTTYGFGMSKNNFKNADSDDTATVIASLRLLLEKEGTYNLAENEVLRARLKKGLLFLLKLQNSDGGFATWELDHLKISKPLQSYSGFVMSESVLEHTCRAVNALALFKEEDPRFKKAHQKALKFILNKQLPNGSFYGGWFINYVFGTSMALSALTTAPYEIKSSTSFKEIIRKSITFIKQHQRADGGFSEGPESYLTGKYAPLTYSSPSQTGLILTALLSSLINEKNESSLKKDLFPIMSKGIQFLVSTQKQNGLWEDQTHIGVVFPRFEYSIYPTIQEFFPIMALGLYSKIYIQPAIKEN